MTLLNNKSFYPTPPKLAARMIKKIKLPENYAAYDLSVLEPSAGKGDLIDALNKDRYDGFSGNGRFRNVSAIESDPDLRACLRGHGIKVIDSDFLAYAGADKFDLIIANPPFHEGDKHLLKAIDIMYRGQIIFLLNAETIRNPYTNTRKLLVQKLDELHADIEYICNAFKDAERQADVDVAIVNITIERKVEDDLFAGCNDKADDPEVKFHVKHEVSTKKKVVEMVAEYNETIRIGTETIIGYYRNYRKIGGFVGLNREVKEHRSETSSDLTGIMQSTMNKLLIDVRKYFWKKAMDLPDVEKRLTNAKQQELQHAINLRADMDFTEANIRSFILNVINGYEDTLMAGVLSVFKRFTESHSWDGDNPNEKNIHYFNGWKTNKAWKVGKKVIIPVYGGGWDRGPFIGCGGKWELYYGSLESIADIDKVMNYFDGMNHYQSIYNAVDMAFKMGYSSGITSTYFTITCYKKGTMHLTFNDEDILRRFNVAACVGKNWLPCNYGAAPFDDLPKEEQSVVESFEGRKSYNENLKTPLFGKAVTVPLLEGTAGEYKDGEPLQQAFNF
jgi:methylase of polypeptide subunit release factors